MSLARRLASQSSIIFAARIFGAGFIFVAQALIARFWGAGILGEFLLVVASVNLVSVVMPLGYHTVGTYFAAEYRAKGQRQQMVAFLLRSYGFVAMTFVGLVLIGPIVLDAIGQGQGAIALHFVPFALLTLGTAIVYVNSAVLIGLKRPFAGFFADTLLRPMIVLGAFLVALGTGVADAGFTQMLWIIGAIIIGLIAGFLARAVVPGKDDMGLGGTLVLGLVGSLIGGFLGWLIFRNDSGDGAFQLSGIIGSFIGAVIALLIWRAIQGRSART